MQDQTTASRRHVFHFEIPAKLCLDSPHLKAELAHCVIPGAGKCSQGTGIILPALLLTDLIFLGLPWSGRKRRLQLIGKSRIHFPSSWQVEATSN